MCYILQLDWSSSIQDTFHCKQDSLQETSFHYSNKDEVQNIEAHMSYYTSQELVLQVTQ